MRAIEDSSTDGTATNGRDHLACVVDRTWIVPEALQGVWSMTSLSVVDHSHEYVESDEQVVLIEAALQGGGGGGLASARRADKHYYSSR